MSRAPISSGFDLDYRAVRSEIDVKDRHGEVVRTIAVFIVDVNDSEELIAHVHFGRIVLAGTCLDDHLVVKSALEIGVELFDFVGFHQSSPVRFSRRRWTFGASHRDVVIFNLRRFWHGLKAKVKSKQQIPRVTHYAIHAGYVFAFESVRYRLR